jgi:D-glycero-alpha-D-manno-heptose-7-phosphate kinase
MIITKTPYRISFFGGGTDYHTWYENHGGSVLSTSINHYSYIIIRSLPKFFDYNYKISWREIEYVNSFEEIKHPVVRESFRKYLPNSFVSLHHEADLPARSGLASSSAFACGLIKAIYKFKNEDISSEELAKKAIEMERDILKENVGVQDQIATSFGGFNHVIINKDGSFKVNPVNASGEAISGLESHMLLFFTGITRLASEIAGEQIKTANQKITELTRMNEMVKEGMELAKKARFEDFGKLLHESWLLKRALSAKISNNTIDEIYNSALSNGAMGGKLLGAGGGGFMLIFAKPENHSRIRKTLGNLIEIPFKFSKTGSEVL